MNYEKLRDKLAEVLKERQLDKREEKIKELNQCLNELRE